MRTIKYILLALFVLTFSSTRITFYVDHQVEQPLDFVEISAIVKASGESLNQTIEEAAAIIRDVEHAVNQYCKSYSKDKKQCEDIVETDRFSIKPQYELVKKRPQFAGFVVAHEMLIKVKQSPLFGKLADDILKKGVAKINSFEWKPEVEVNGQEIAISQGIKQATAICKQIGMTLSSVVSVQQVSQFDEQDDLQKEQNEDEQQQQQEQEQKQEPRVIKEGFVYYKFVVDCTKK